jgi:hypothetical protein
MEHFSILTRVLEEFNKSNRPADAKTGLMKYQLRSLSKCIPISIKISASA